MILHIYSIPHISIFIVLVDLTPPVTSIARGQGGPILEFCTTERIEEIKELLLEIYEEHSSEKMTKIDRLLGKYKGREEEFLRFVHHKYKLDTCISTIQAQIETHSAAKGLGPLCTSKDSSSDSNSSSSSEFIPKGGSGPSSIELDSNERSLVTCGTRTGVSEIVPISTSESQIIRHSILHSNHYIDSVKSSGLESDLIPTNNSADINSNAVEVMEKSINENNDVECSVSYKDKFNIETEFINPTSDSIRNSKDSLEVSCTITNTESGPDTSLTPTASKNSMMISTGKYEIEKIKKRNRSEMISGDKKR